MCSPRPPVPFGLSLSNPTGFAIDFDGEILHSHTVQLWMRQARENTGYKPALVCVHPRPPVPFGLSLSNANGVGAIDFDGDEFCIHTRFMPRLWMRQARENTGYKPALVCVHPRPPVPFGLSLSKANGIGAIDFDGDEFCIHTRFMPRLWMCQADKNAGYKPALPEGRERAVLPEGRERAVRDGSRGGKESLSPKCAMAFGQPATLAMQARKTVPGRGIGCRLGRQ